ncbi:hypothetical protein J2W83_003912 [Pseudomonas hunanensis]|uniref:Uncharacterized protein n=1 Tax=Pseudomonas hunanensis TaxID=1247546 RepID=A0ACC6K787_9PSED|nr:hypothetical protein [Pseudomonas hunanensis]
MRVQQRQWIVQAVEFRFTFLLGKEAWRALDVLWFGGSDFNGNSRFLEVPLLGNT